MDDQELVKNLDRVARNIEVALKTLSEGKEPINASAAQLPLAKQYLADLKRMTEEGTHVVMDVTEALQDAQGRVRELSQKLAWRAVDAGDARYIHGKRNPLYPNLHSSIVSRPGGPAYCRIVQYAG